MSVSQHKPKQPVTFTKAATLYLSAKVKQQAGGVAFRLSVKNSGCNGLAYVTDVVTEINNQDIQYSVSDDLTICIDPKAIGVLSGTEIDYAVYENSLGLKKLIFHNPNVKGACGCGESFNVEKSDE